MFQKQLLLCFIAKKENLTIAIAHDARHDVLIPNTENCSNISLQNSHFIFIIFTLEVKYYQLVTVWVHLFALTVAYVNVVLPGELAHIQTRELTV